MNNMRKILSVCFALLLIATTTVAGTLAYANWTAEQYAENMEGKLAIELLQQQRSKDEGGNTILVNYKDSEFLVPLVDSAQYDGTNFDKYGMPVAEGYVDNIVRVKNTGLIDAYVRVLVAIPSALDNINDAGLNALHWNVGNRFMADGNFSAENNINSEFKYFSWKYAETTSLEGINYNIYIFTYTEPLAEGEMTDAAAFVGFYLDKDVDIVDGHILLDGIDTGFMDDTVKIHVKAQAVQSYGFESAETAFSEAGLSNNPWSETTKH